MINRLIPEILQRIRFSNGKGIFDSDLERLQSCVFKVKPFYFPFKKACTTIGNTIYLPKNFESWSQMNQQAVLIHEAVHIKQYKDGELNIPEYLTSKVARFKIEIDAEKRETLYRCYTKDIKESHIGEYAINMANTWPQQYLITGLKNTSQWYNLFRQICEDSFKFLRTVQ